MYPNTRPQRSHQLRMTEEAFGLRREEFLGLVMSVKEEKVRVAFLVRRIDSPKKRPGTCAPTSAFGLFFYEDF